MKPQAKLQSLANERRLHPDSQKGRERETVGDLLVWSSETFMNWLKSIDFDVRTDLILFYSVAIGGNSPSILTRANNYLLTLLALFKNFVHLLVLFINFVHLLISFTLS